MSLEDFETVKDDLDSLRRLFRAMLNEEIGKPFEVRRRSSAEDQRGHFCA
jgi:hypothetical protein